MSAAPSPAASPAAIGVTPAHVVFGRGGVRGIAMAGAATALCRAGYRIERASGVSVGAIVAALVASGHTPDELRGVVWELDYHGMRDGAGLAGRVPWLGPLWRLFTRLGCYDGDVLEAALRDVLARKGVRTFGDLRVPVAFGRGGAGSRYRLQVLCADVTRGRLVVLPDDCVHYDLDPDRLDVARALRMSASLPFFFRPVRLGDGDRASLIVDGGLVAGIPYHLFHASRNPGYVTLGVRAGPGPGRRPPVTGPLSFLAAAYYTALRANQQVQDDAYPARSIDIDCGGVGAIDFSLSDPAKQALFDAGFAAAQAFLRSRGGTEAARGPGAADRNPASDGTTLAGNWPGAHLSIAGG